MSIRQTLTKSLYTVTKPQLLANLQELERFQWLSLAELQALQQQYLQRLLEYAYTYVPYYRDLFNQIGLKPADVATDPTAFQKIPPLTKRLIRQNYDRLVTTEPSRRANLFRVKTGGTTGEPLWFTQDQIYRNYNFAHDYHIMTWSGWQLGQPQFWLWGHVPDTAPTGLKAMAGQAKDWLINRFDTNAFIMSPDSLTQFAKQLGQHPQGVLWSYVSTAYRFAQFLQERPALAAPIKLRAIYTAAEPLFDQQRALIEQVLGCRVFNCYSSIDTGDIACECDRHNGLHITMRNCYVEVLRDGQSVADGEAGEFVLTNLINYAMPMIRYQIEDWGRKSTRICNCGRGLPLVEVVEGRKIDLFKTRDGRTVYGAFAKDLLPTIGSVKQFQVVQKSLDLVIFRIVTESIINPEKLQHIEQATKNALGHNVTVQFEFVDSLPATPTGKHRYLVSEI